MSRVTVPSALVRLFRTQTGSKEDSWELGKEGPLGGEKEAAELGSEYNFAEGQMPGRPQWPGSFDRHCTLTPITLPQPMPYVLRYF